MALLLIVLLALLAGVAMLVRSNRWRPWLVPLGASLHLAGTFRVLWGGPADSWGKSLWLAPDPPGKLVLLLLSVLFFISAWYTVGYLRHRPERSNRVFCACLLAF
jgi:hydrogenase-4 component F